MIVNATKKRIIAKHFSKTNGFGNITGLLGKNKPEALIFKTRFGIHTFFMKFSIDLLIVDKNKKVIIAKRNVKPNRIVIWNFLYNTVIELPPGSLYKSKTTKGDILKFKL